MKSRYSIISAFLREHNTYNGICPVKRREGVKIIARKKRVWFPGATYHLMERGIRRQAIYEEEGDYQVFMYRTRCQVPLNFYKQTNTYLQIVNVVVE